MSDALAALRAQYPQYDNLSDQELAARVIEKYPQYREALGGIASPKTNFDVSNPEKVGEIRRPPTFLEGAWAQAKKLPEEILPMAGAFGGAALGMATPLGPAGAALGSGGGYAIGKQGNRTIDALYRLLSGQPQREDSGPLATAGNVAHDFALGTAFEVVPQAVLKGGGVLADILRGSGVGATAEDLAVREAARRQQIPLTAGPASGSPSIAMLERAPSNFPIGRQTTDPVFQNMALGAQRAGERLAGTAGPARTLEQAGNAVQGDVRALAQAQADAGGEVFDRFAAGLGSPQGPTSRTGLGESIQEGLDAAQKSARGRADAAYQAADASLEGVAGIPLPNTAALAGEILSLEGRLSGLANRGATKAAGGVSGAFPEAEVTPPLFDASGKLIKGLGLDKPTDMPPDLVDEVLKRLTAAARNAPDDVTKRQIGQLVDAMRSDVTAWAERVGSPYAQQRAAAASQYRDEVVPYFAERAAMRRQFMDSEPSVAATKLLALRDPGLLRDVMSQLPPAQAAQVQQAVVQQIRSAAMRNGVLDQGALETALKQYGDENLGILLGPRYADLQGVRRTLASSSAPTGVQPELARIADNASPEGIIPALTQGRVKSLEDFDAVWQVASPETQQQIRSSMLNDVMSQSLDPKTGVFSTDRFMTAKSKVPQDIWDRVLTTDMRGTMRDLEMVFQRINKYARIAANPSQTAQTLGGMGQLREGAGLAAAGLQIGGGALLANNTYAGNEDPISFAKQAFMLLSPYWGGKLMMSGPGQRFLTSPQRQPYTPNNSLSALTKILGVGVAE